MNEEPKRTSIWSISEGWLTAYFLLFTVQFIAGVSFVVWYETAFATRDALPETMANILLRAGVIPILSASTSYIFAEGGRLTMVISNWVEKKLEERRLRQQQEFIAELRAEGFEQGRKEGFEQGRAYERERIESEANGEHNDDQHHENGR